MIIQNNFNKKDVNPLSDYKSIGKNIEDEKSINDDDVNNDIIQDIINKDHEYDEDDFEEKDKWSFFK